MTKKTKMTNAYNTAMEEIEMSLAEILHTIESIEDQASDSKIDITTFNGFDDVLIIKAICSKYSIKEDK